MAAFPHRDDCRYPAWLLALAKSPRTGDRPRQRSGECPVRRHRCWEAFQCLDVYPELNPVEPQCQDLVAFPLKVMCQGVLLGKAWYRRWVDCPRRDSVASLLTATCWVEERLVGEHSVD
jgi:hypothetical protein